MKTGNKRVSSEHFAEHKTPLVIDFTKVWNALQGKSLWILSCTLFLSLLATLVSFLFFQDAYQSSAKLLLDTNSSPKSETNDSLLKGMGFESNPYKNQEELLKSQLIFERVSQQLKQGKFQFPYKKPADLADKVLSAEHIQNTNFIRISAKADKPSAAKKLAQIYMQSYLDLTQEISYAPIQQQKKYFESQIKQAEMVLAGINHKIESCQKSYGILDLDIKNQNQIRQLLNLDTQSKSTQADLAQKRAEAARLRQLLKLKRGEFDSALQAVAKGQDRTLIALQEKLQDLQKEYDAKALIYAPTNPDMVQLQRKLDTLKNQITDQQILTVGNTPHAKINQIKDSVRTNMVNRLAMADSESAALQNKLITLQSQYQGIRQNLKNLPQQQLEYTRLLVDQKNQEDTLTKLKQSLSETQIQEAAIHKRLMVIDQPNLPEKPVAPLRWQLIAGAAAIGLFLSLGAIVGQSVLSQYHLRPDFIEQALNIPILGNIPWLSNEKWHYLRSRGRLEILSTDADPNIIKAYQDLALNLKVRRNTLGKNTIILSQLLEEKGHAYILANLACCLAQGGDRVLLVDADLRKPGLHQAFNHSLDYEQGLPELINSVSELLHRKKDAQVQDILQLVSTVATPSGVHPQLEYLNAGLVLGNTFEFLNAKSFDVLLNVLKAGYDWVLVSAPPLLKHPDCSVLLGYADGLLLLADQETNESHLIAAQKKVERLHSMIYGAILRNT
jgi:succinoglycan biosynthesis transport protein ExoP